MGPRPRLMRLAGTVAVAVSLAVPALAGDAASKSGLPLAFERAAPSAGKNLRAQPDLRAKDAPAPSESRTPPPPSGCPFRDGELELIV
jgi:hypothetical protein